MISAAIIVKNGQRELREVLESLSFVDEIILIDTGSTDQSLAIAREFDRVKIYERAFTGFGELRNEAASLAKNDWILAVDADEVLSPALQEEISKLKLDENSLYEIPFKNYFNGKWIKGCGWHPESHIRLYNKTKTRFSTALVHEGIQKTGLNIVKLQNHIRHTPYSTISDFLIKCERYSELFAEQNRGKRSSSPKTALIHGLWAFFRSYFLKRGFLVGYEGYLISKYQADVAIYKYLKLYHKNGV